MPWQAVAYFSCFCQRRRNEAPLCHVVVMCETVTGYIMENDLNLIYQIFLFMRFIKCKHMCISCVPHVTNMSPHVATWESHVGSYLLDYTHV